MIQALSLDTVFRSSAFQVGCSEEENADFREDTIAQLKTFGIEPTRVEEALVEFPLTIRQAMQMGWRDYSLADNLSVQGFGEFREVLERIRVPSAPERRDQDSAAGPTLREQFESEQRVGNQR